MSDEQRRVVIAGASGFVGRYLQDAFRDEGYEVVTVGRTGDAVWGNTVRIRALVDGAALVVNMAGKSVNCRYGRRNRAEIVRSRVDTTLELAEAIRGAEHPPPLWVNASTATIYRHADDRPQDEVTGELGEGFSVSVAKAWEDALFTADLPHTRRVALRMTIVFGDGSALVPLLRLAQAGLGGRSSTDRGSRPAHDSVPARTTTTGTPTAASASAGCTSRTSSGRSGSSATTRTSTDRSTSRARSRRTTAR